ncbi:hypothetical protein AAEO56_04685 [Flavobacterium sp. DGU11]|uniref:Uncharacterized protein n=1 Tax=Flavobacterium arundinis TaxID=3139143 RepID=A0ABU9HUP7_9FLAO
MEEKLKNLEQIVKETSNCEHRISFDGTEWRIYIVASQTIFRGSLEEVVNCTTEEFLSYREVSKQGEHSNNYKYAY